MIILQYKVTYFILKLFILAKILGDVISEVQSKEIKSSVKELSLNTIQLINKRGYVAKEYYVTTEDGYILTMTRIENTGPVVFMAHGILNSADDWLALGADSLPFLLFRNGYDVYLANTRGNKYSKEHISISINDRNFWNFSFHEIGLYDLPAMIDFALETSNKSEAFYIGHSQGTTAFFVMASLKPEYNEKIPLMISLSTIARMDHAKAPILRALIPLAYKEKIITENINFYRYIPKNPLLKTMVKRLCPHFKVTLRICATILFGMYGLVYEKIDHPQFSVQTDQFSTGTSIKNVLHYAQLIASKDFQRYDYNDANLEIYGSILPPSYAVEKITVPIVIFHSDDDWLSSYKDVEILIKKLPNVVDTYRVPSTSFNHNSYIYGKNAKNLVYSKIISLVNEYKLKIT